MQEHGGNLEIINQQYLYNLNITKPKQMTEEAEQHPTNQGKKYKILTLKVELCSSASL